MVQVLTFTVSGARFAIDLEQSQKVVPLMAMRPVPKADPCVVGVMNLGGTSLPVIDLSLRLDLADVKPYTVATSVVVCRDGDACFGMIADRIDGVETVADDAVFLDEILRAKTMPYTGLFHARGGQQTLILDLDRLFKLDQSVAPLPDLTDVSGTAAAAP